MYEHRQIHNKGGFPLIAEVTRCHTFTKEINHANARCQYFNKNLYCKHCQRVFPAMVGNEAQDRLSTNRPIKSQGSWSGPHTNRMPYNKNLF